MNRLSNAIHGTVITLYRISHILQPDYLTFLAGVGELILQMMIQAEGEGKGKDN